MMRHALAILASSLVLAVSGAAQAEERIDFGASMQRAVESSLAGSASAFDAFGGLAETPFMENLRRGTLGGVEGKMVRRADKAMAPFRRAVRTTSKSFTFKATPWLTMVADSLPAVVAPILEGDKTGAAAGAAAVLSGNLAASGGAALFGAAGTVAGAAVGSYFPVVGTALGQTVGGAVGRVAGGFIAASAYEMLVKDHVTQGVEGAILSLFDPRPAQIRAREDMLRRQAAQDLKPIWEMYHHVSKGFGLDSIELMPLPTILYRPQPPAETPGAAPAPPIPESLVMVASFDAELVSGTWEHAGGATGAWDAGDNVDADLSPDCRIFSVRGGYFYHSCPYESDHAFEKSTVHIDSNSIMIGRVTGNQITGVFFHWARNFYVNSSDRDNGEYMRVARSGEIAGQVNPDGTIHLVQSYRFQQVWDRPMKHRDGAFRFTSDSFVPRESDAASQILRTTAVYRVTGTGQDGTLTRPGLTADHVRSRIGQDIDLPPVFFQHGVQPPSLEFLK